MPDRRDVERLAAEARERLAAWANDIEIGRFGAPHYRNPGEVKRDVRALLAVEAERAKLAEALQTEKERSGRLRRLFRRRMREWRECSPDYSYGEEDVEQFLIEAEREALASVFPAGKGTGDT